MSELDYMTGNDDFDLPRWQPHHYQDTLSSSAQAAQAAQQALASPSYSGSAPPPPPPQSLPPPATAPASRQQRPIISTHHSVTAAGQAPESAPTRNPRLSHLFNLDGDTGIGSGQHQYLSTGQAQLSRSASLNSAVGGAGAAGIGSGALSSRRYRQHMLDDLESAYMDSTPQGPLERHRALGTSQQQSFYPVAVQYTQQQQPQLTGHAPSASLGGNNDPYNDPQIDERTTSKSPRRGHGSQVASPMLDPYSQIQQQVSPQASTTAYSPTSTAYQYGSTTPSYQSHTTGVPQIPVKGPPASPLGSPFSSSRALPPPPASAQNASHYSHYAMDTSSPGPSHSAQATPHHLSSHTGMMPLRQSMSTPNTPLSYQHSQQGQAQYQPSTDDAMDVGVNPHKRRASGFKRVRDHRDLRPYVNPQPAGRRADSNGQFLSVLRLLTTNITDTYHICNPQFRYESASNPRRVLTKPSKPCHNDGFDNEDYDYILYVNDWLGSESNKYLILDVLGQGTFGQVVKCQNMKTHEIVAVKVVKNKPAYFNQSMMEVTILELLNNQCDPHDEHHILRLRDSFIHRSHLCLVFELLSSNLYELIKQNQFQGLSTQLVKVFTAQLLDALSVLKDARLIHCDLKPENILLKSLQSPQIKVIDFGSACHERQTVYTYIQSRFYRSPEVLLGIPYNAAIDMWSLGCIAVELFLGLPLFPGTSEYNQITRIVEMLGPPPTYMLEIGKQSGHFFDSYVDHYGQKKYRLKSIEQYSRERNTQEQPGKQYFKHTKLPDIINSAPMPNFKSSKSGHEMEKELNNRAAFIDFCQGLLNLDPIQRWTPQQARMHPFITGEKFTGPFVPPTHLNSAQPSSTSQSATPGTDPKRPYGGLVPQQPKGQRAYQDAATYRQHLDQHQAYTQQQAAASNVYRNPYVTNQQQSQQVQASAQAHRQDSQQFGATSQPMQHQASVSHGNMTLQPVNNLSMPSNAQPNPPSTAYYPSSRTRANTINNMDAIPPALARLQHMNHDVITGRNALTPVLNRDDAMREWERRQAGKAAATQPYPQLEYLQQQAELAASGAITSWNQPRRYQAQPSSLSHSYQPPAAIVMDEPDRREAILSSVRSAARSDQTSQSLYGSAGAANLTSPPQAYAGGSHQATRYAGTYAQQQPASSFDTIDRRADISNLYVPMQPDQYQSYGSTSGTSPSHHEMTSQQRVAQTSAVPSFYGAGVVPSGGTPSNGQGQRNPFAAGTQNAVNSSRDSQRSNGMDMWPR